MTPASGWFANERVRLLRFCHEFQFQGDFILNRGYLVRQAQDLYAIIIV